jgi:galactose-1-phosphate uridylyltransferase
MVGYEMLGEPQRDLTVESVAHKLRQLAEPIKQQLMKCP